MTGYWYALSKLFEVSVVVSVSGRSEWWMVGMFEDVVEEQRVVVARRETTWRKGSKVCLSSANMRT